MIKNFALLCLISTTIFTCNIVKSDEIRYKGNAFRVFNEYSLDLSKEDKLDDFWTSKNEGYLNESQKEKINSLRDKVKNGESLTITEKNELKAMKSEVIKTKLGEEKYKELEKLIEKREGTVELTLPERERLYKLNKEARE
jgi:hypothetical protein